MAANLLVGVRGPFPDKSSVLTANTECFPLELRCHVVLHDTASNVDVQIAIVYVA